MRLLGYGDRLSVPAGGAVGFRVSCEAPSFTPGLVRLRRGGSARHQHDLQEETVAAGLPERVAGRVQTTVAGSFVTADVGRGRTTRSVGLAAWIAPTLLGPDEQNVVALLSADRTAGFALTLSATGPRLRDAAGAELARLDLAPALGRWVHLTACVSDAGEVRLSLRRLGSARDAVTRSLTGPVLWEPGVLQVAGRGPGAPDAFNGRIARPVATPAGWSEVTAARLGAGVDAVELLGADGVGALALGREPAATVAVDDGDLTTGGRIVNRPAGSVPGPFWQRRETDPRRCAADEYDALHFHDDDLDDAGWDTDLTLRVPDDVPSGVYALKVAAGDDVDRIPVIVTPRPGATPAPVVVVLPTWTYLAYANWRTYAELEEQRAALYGERRGVDARDHWLARHPEFGKSLYDVHTDGSGVAFSSRARPIVNIRPDYWTPTTRGERHLVQDLSLLHWLDGRGEPYDVITDDELHERGTAALAPYRVVVTGSHPEYSSARMLDAYDEYTGEGGRLMYLGGNGFYHVTDRHPGTGGAVEIRRARGSMTGWASGAGEEHLSTTGEHGGLWRWRGRAPQALFGVGMTAQGFDAASGYRRLPASADDAVDWVFDGTAVSVGDVFGDEGPGLGGAAGDEIDRADVALGTPEGAVVLATSFGHSSMIGLVPDDQPRTYAPMDLPPDPRIRSDVVIFGRPGGGAVFAVGSIAWSTAMTHCGGDNDVARITANVLARFRDHVDPVPV